MCGFVRPKSELYNKNLQLNILCRVLTDQGISKFRVSIMFSVASQQANLLQNASGSVGRAKCLGLLYA